MPRGGPVYVVDDVSAERRAIGSMLATAGFAFHPYLSGGGYLDDIPFLKPGCVLLDMPTVERGDPKVFTAISELSPHFPILAMAHNADVATAVRAMKLGARDFLEKPLQMLATGEALDHAFATLDRQVDAYNQQYGARTRLSLLTPREKDVLRGLVRGMSNKALASELGLGVRTIEGHRASMLNRLGVRTLSAALVLVFHANLDDALAYASPG